MKVESHNIEVEELNETVLVHLEKVYQLTFNQLKVEEWIDEEVEEAFVMEGGYAEHYTERAMYSSSEDYLENHSYEEVIQDILEAEGKDILSKAKIITCCGDEIENKPEVYRCPTCKEAI
jgi:hypothetical protein